MVSKVVVADSIGAVDDPAAEGLHHLHIAQIFNQCFRSSYATEMKGGADEPHYLPAAGGQYAQLHYREDFAASALHEAAHWCIAGVRRRLMEDFGYAYLTPPRDDQQQLRFFAFEVRNQSLESLFAAAAGNHFDVSADNPTWDLTEFRAQVGAQREATRQWLQSDAGERARTFIEALSIASSAGR